jgi:hypothetical protein
MLKSVSYCSLYVRDFVLIPDYSQSIKNCIFSLKKNFALHFNNCSLENLVSITEAAYSAKVGSYQTK